MNVQVIIVLLVLLFSAFGYFFSAINRFRNINDKTLYQKTTYRLRVSQKDTLHSNEYKHFIAFLNLCTSVLFILLLVVTYLTVKDITTYTVEDLEFVSVMANGAALVFLLRINSHDLLAERFVSREKEEKKQHYKIGYLVLNIAVLVAFLYNLFMM